jgi:hypothetical protein
MKCDAAEKVSSEVYSWMLSPVVVVKEDSLWKYLLEATLLEVRLSE